MTKCLKTLVLVAAVALTFIGGGGGSKAEEKPTPVKVTRPGVIITYAPRIPGPSRNNFIVVRESEKQKCAAKAADISQRLLQRPSNEYSPCEKSTMRLFSDREYWIWLLNAGHDHELRWLSVTGLYLYKLNLAVDDVDRAEWGEIGDDDRADRVAQAKQAFNKILANAELHLRSMPLSLIGSHARLKKQSAEESSPSDDPFEDDPPGPFDSPVNNK